MEKKVIVKPEANMVIVLLIDKWGDTVSKGISKCHPDDVFNEELGEKIANVRAWIKYYKLSEKQWTDWIDRATARKEYFEKEIAEDIHNREIATSKLETLLKEYDEILKSI